MLLRRRRRATNGTEKVDYALIARLEIECGLVEPTPSPVASLVATSYNRLVGSYMTSTDPSRPVLQHMWDDA